MDKQKQIEEMAKDIFDYARTLVDIKTATEDSVFVNRYKEAVKGYAKYLVNAGYRKIHEGSVVLTREEHIQMLKDLANSNEIAYLSGYGKGSTETAEKFAEKLKAKLTDIIPFEDYDVADWNYDGMDIEKSIDEICKEITEEKNG